MHPLKRFKVSKKKQIISIIILLFTTLVLFFFVKNLNTIKLEKTIHKNAFENLEIKQVFAQRVKETWSLPSNKQLVKKGGETGIFSQLWQSREGYMDTINDRSLFIPYGCPHLKRTKLKQRELVYYDTIPLNYYDDSCPGDINPIVRAEDMNLCPFYRLFESCSSKGYFYEPPEDFLYKIDPSQHPDKPSIPLIGIPTILNPYYIQRSVFSIDYPVDKIVIYWTENVNDLECAIYQIKKLLGDRVTIVHSPENRGLSHNWNTLFQQIEPDLKNWGIILGDDTMQLPMGLESVVKWVESKRNIDNTLPPMIFDANFLPASTPFFSAFGLTLSAYLKTGTFDENIFICYCEDVDYMWRVLNTDTVRFDKPCNWTVVHGKDPEHYTSGQWSSNIPDRLIGLMKSNYKIHVKSGFCPYLEEKFGPNTHRSIPKFVRARPWKKLEPNNWIIDHKFKHRVLAGCDYCIASKPYPYPEEKPEEGELSFRDWHHLF
eukprot:TRINITY_DN13776_c0_g1_i1.p1 TRINITY_DN13776_c0_g1~~TRINITY_DN13776_c0_g1_i1.p1  ORF type:complete len:497 (-),score=87.76 TRINITY_DN13776_c0_g1_i1:113-1576(-)